MSQSDPLQSLYPFLHGQRQDAARLDQTLLESVRQKARASVDAKAAFFAENGAEVVAVARTLAAIYRHNGRLYTMGNGGSSCDSAHIALEFQHPITAGRPALTAVHLGADTAMMSAVGNDVGFEHVYLRQVVAQARPGDGLIGVSTSGNSANLLAAFAKAKEMRVATIGLSGYDGGEMARGAELDHCLVVRSDSIHRIQETHVAIYHILWDLTHTLLADDRGGLAAGRKT